MKREKYENNFQKILRNYRLQNNLTQKEFANELQISISVLSSYETPYNDNRRLPNKKNLKNIAKKIMLDFDILYIATLLDKENLSITQLKNLVKKFEKFQKTIDKQ